MSARLRHGRAKAAGNDPRFGACCAIPRIGEPLAMARPNSGPGSVSRARSVNGKPCRVATLVVMSGRARSGLRSRCLRLVSEEMFALAQEQLEKNKRHSPRRTIEPTLAARHAGMRTVRLRLVPHIHPHVEAKTELLSLHRFGWISTAERAGLYESANQTRLSGSVRVERDHPAAGRSGADPNRNRSPPRGRTKGGPACASAKRNCAGNRLAWRRAANAW